MRILCPREEEEQLLFPVKSFIFPLFREFKPQTNELVGQAGEFINFFQSTFMYVFFYKTTKYLPLQCPHAPLRGLWASGPAVNWQKHLWHLLPKEKTGPNSGLSYTSINSRWADWVHIPTLFLIYLCPTFWMSSQLLSFIDERQFAKNHFKQRLWISKRISDC